MHTFVFADDNLTIDATQQIIRIKIFEYIPVSISSFHHSITIVQHCMEYYNIIIHEPDDDDPCDINIPEYEGTRVVDGSGVSSDNFLNPLKVNKVNIGSPKSPKFDNIGDYWVDEALLGCQRPSGKLMTYYMNSSICSPLNFH